MLWTSPLLPTLILWLGAAVLPPIAHFWSVARRWGKPVVIGIAILPLLLWLPRLPIEQNLIRWPILSPWYTMPIAHRVDAPATLLVTVLLGGSAILAILHPSSQRSPSYHLALLGAATAALFANGLISLGLSWLILDLLLAWGASPNQRRGVTLSLLATMTLGGIALYLNQIGPYQTAFDDPTSIGWRTHPIPILLTLALVLRLAPFPLPPWGRYGSVPPSEASYTWIIPTLTLGASARILPLLNNTIPWPALWLAFSILNILISILSSPTQPLTHTLQHCAIGMWLLSLAFGLPLNLWTLWSLHLLLTWIILPTTVEQLGEVRLLEPQTYPRLIPPAIAILSLIGFPLTLGFLARAAVYRTLWDTGQYLLFLLQLAIESTTLAILFHKILNHPPDEDAPQTALPRNAHIIVMFALVLPLLIFGLAPGWSGKAIGLAIPLGNWFRYPTLPVWAALFLPTTAAIALQPQISRWNQVAAKITPYIAYLDHIYPLIEKLLDRVLTLFREIDQILISDGYIAWATAIFIAILFFLLTT